MTSISLRPLALLVALGLCVLMADQVKAQQLDFFRQSRREFVQDIQRDHIQELQEELQRVMTDERDGQFEREEDLKIAINDALIADIEDEQERRAAVLLNENQFKIDKRTQEMQQELALRSLPLDAEEDARLQAARNTERSLIDSFCDANSTDPTVRTTCKNTINLLNLPRNYIATFYNLFPEFDPVSAQNTRDVNEFALNNQFSGEIDEQTIPR